MNRTFCVLVVRIALAILALPSVSWAQQAVVADFLPVDEAYPTQAALLDGEIRVSWLMPDGYYLYLHSLKIVGVEGSQIGELVVPEGIKKHDEFFGDTEVFYDFLEISAPVVGASGGLVNVEVHYQGCADEGLCYPPEFKQFTFEWGEGGPQDSKLNQEDQPIEVQGATNLLLILGSALLAGVILNVMPCVFPVLALKAVGVIQSETHSGVAHGLGYTIGIVGTLLIVAVILLALRAAGEQVGWGFQLQSPGFVVCMALVFFVIGMNMLGLLEIPGFGVSMNSSNAIATGVLAVVVATPCTVPFMAVAIGYGLLVGGIELVLIMVAMGLGLALPYVLVTTVPAIAKRLPRSGPWLGTFKSILAFPILLSVVWLLWVLARQEGADAIAWALIGALVLGALMLVGRRFLQWLRWVWLTMCMVIGIVAWGVASDDRSSEDGVVGGFDLQLFDEMVDKNLPLFVNVTADWCLTCLVNEQSTLNRDEVVQFFEKYGITYVKVDWTHRDAQVTQLLERFGRVGVPLYIYYPIGQNPKLLPQILTPDLVTSQLKSDLG